jgi:hypothetical protein
VQHRLGRHPHGLAHQAGVGGVALMAAQEVKLPPLTGQFDLLESGRWTQ